MARCVAIANYWAADYKILLFNSIYTLHNDFKVLYVAETEAIRNWKVKKDDLQFPYEIMFKGEIDNLTQHSVVVRTWRMLNIMKPDVVILWGYSHVACWAGFFWAKINGKKTIIWSSSNEDDKQRSFLKEKLKSYLVKKCNAANVYGQRSKDYLVKLGMQKDRIFIKGNTTNNAFYYNQTTKLKSDREVLCMKYNVPTHNFLYIGRFSPEKNILCLLKAYRRLKIEKGEWGLILIGNGPQKNKIEDYINKYAVEDVHMTGFKQKEDIPQYLAISDILVLPSTCEPWGLVVNEAMASGLPVLVSKKCGCYPDLIKEGINGFSFDPFDETKLFDCMKSIIANKEHLTKMGQASLDIIKNYTHENAAKIILKTIEFASE